jgi:hypothetical protein
MRNDFSHGQGALLKLHLTLSCERLSLAGLKMLFVAGEDARGLYVVAGVVRAFRAGASRSPTRSTRGPNEVVQETAHISRQLINS